MAGPQRLIDRIEAALNAADRVHDLATDLNEECQATELAQALKDYRKAVRGLDLRSSVNDSEKESVCQPRRQPKS